MCSCTGQSRLCFFLLFYSSSKIILMRVVCMHLMHLQCSIGHCERYKGVFLKSSDLTVIHLSGEEKQRIRSRLGLSGDKISNCKKDSSKPCPVPTHKKSTTLGNRSKYSLLVCEMFCAILSDICRLYHEIWRLPYFV